LRHVVGKERAAVIPDVVADELRSGAPGRAHLQTILDAGWIEERCLISEAEIEAFATFSSLLLAEGRNRAQAGVLALARANSATAIVDDGPARRPPRPTESRTGEHSASSATLCGPATHPSLSSRQSPTTCSKASIGCRSRRGASRSGPTTTGS